MSYSTCVPHDISTMPLNIVLLSLLDQGSSNLLFSLLVRLWLANISSRDDTLINGGFDDTSHPLQCFWIHTASLECIPQFRHYNIKVQLWSIFFAAEWEIHPCPSKGKKESYMRSTTSTLPFFWNRKVPGWTLVGWVGSWIKAEGTGCTEEDMRFLSHQNHYVQ